MDKITFKKLFKFFFWKLIPSFGLALFAWYMGIAIIYYAIIALSNSTTTLSTF